MIINYNLNIIANNIRILRIKRKWKFSYIARKTGIEEHRLRKMESKEAIPKYKELYKLSRLYEVTIDDLVFKKLE